MKTHNPFLVSSSLQNNLQHRGHRRFKNVFFAVLAIHVVLFLCLLIQGCRTTQSAGVQPDSTIAMTDR